MQVRTTGYQSTLGPGGVFPPALPRVSKRTSLRSCPSPSRADVDTIRQLRIRPIKVDDLIEGLAAALQVPGPEPWNGISLAERGEQVANIADHDLGTTQEPALQLRAVLPDSASQVLIGTERVALDVDDSQSRRLRTNRQGE